RRDTHRHELHLRRHGWCERDRDSRLAALARHRPVAAKRVLDVIEVRSRRARAELRVQLVEIGTAVGLVAIQKQVLRPGPLRDAIVPLYDEARGSVTCGGERW